MIDFVTRSNSWTQSKKVKGFKYLQEFLESKAGF